MLGKLLNRRGKVEGESTVEIVQRRLDSAQTAEDRAGWATVLENLDKGWRMRGPYELRNSLQTWEEVLYATIADGTQVLNTTTETIMVPNYTIPAGYLYQGRVLKYTVYFDVSTVITTPGTITMRLRWNGVAGTVLAASGAYVPDPTAALTTRTGFVEYYLTCRSIGGTGTVMVVGRMAMGLHNNDTVALLATNLDMGLIPQNAPAVAVVDTAAAAALSPTVQFSVPTATTQLTAHSAVLETLT